MKKNTTEFMEVLTKWWLGEPAKIMSLIYWFQGQIPPTDPKIKQQEWDKIVKQLNKKNPAPEGTKIKTI